MRYHSVTQILASSNSLLPWTDFQFFKSGNRVGFPAEFQVFRFPNHYFCCGINQVAFQQVPTDGVAKAIGQRNMQVRTILR